MVLVISREKKEGTQNALQDKIMSNNFKIRALEFSLFL